MRREHGPSWLRTARCIRELGRFRHRLLQSRRFGSLRRSKQGEVHPLSAKDRFTALQSGEIDVLSRNTTWTINRDTALGLKFRPVTYYDGQGFMVRKELNVKSALELSGAAVCVQSGTTTELNLADYFKTNNLQYNPVVFDKLEEINTAYDSGRCDVYTTDQSGLYADASRR